MTLKTDEHNNYNKALKLMDEGTQKDIENARAILSQLIAVYDRCIDLRFLHAATDQMLGNYDISIRLLEKILEDGGQSLCETRYKSVGEVRAWANHNLGIAYYYKREYCKAEGYLIEATKFNLIDAVDVKNPLFFFDLGLFYHNLERYEDAEREFCKALANIEIIKQYEIKHPGSGLSNKLNEIDETEQKIKLYLGRIYYKTNNWRDAENIFQQALLYFCRNSDKNPHRKLVEASILLDIAKMELDKENDEIAKSYLNRACSIYSSQLLYIKDLPITKSSIELDNLSAVYNNLGIIFYKRGDYSNAKEHFIKAHEFKNNSATVYNNLANVYAKVGDIERAESCYHQALIYKPELKAARENIKLLRKSEPVSWWDWWFHSDTMLRDEKMGIGRLTDKILRFGSLKKSIGVLLLVVLFSLLASVAVPVVPIIGGGYTEEKTTVENTTVINTTAANITFINTTFGSTTAGNATIGNTTLANITKVSSTTIPSVSKSPTNDYNKSVINLSSTVTTKTNQTKTVSPEIRLLFAALVIFLLLHPQIRGFSAGTIKIDLEPTAVSKGSKDQFTVMSL